MPLGAGVVWTAERFLGAPYRNGGGTPAGFDCSGFVQYVFARVGHDVLGPATVLKPIKVKTDTGPIVLYLGQKLLIERNAGSGYVVAVLPDDRRVTVPSSRLLFTAGS